MRRFASVAALALLAGLGFALASGPASAQSKPEFQQDFYNASRCMDVKEFNDSGIRTITAKNLCNAQVAALICYRIITGSGVYSVPGWYCEYSNLYNPGSVRTISRGGFYHPKLKIAACAAANVRCDRVIRSIDVRVGDSFEDPEKVAKAVRSQTGAGG
ncbi:MAG: hypothetical protein R8L07_08695 [Alphaproteobacteria bacterium]|nr:hypothetical protein [Alphaproteobacteria bacterium]